jgi:hypothetical protein
VAVAALQLGVRACDGETYSRVIETRGLPCGRVVAVLTCLWKPERDVIRICGSAEIWHVAPYADRRRPLVLATHVATQAIEGGVRAGEGVACKFQMIKASAEPSCDGMTLFASARETGGGVVGGCRLLIGCGVAGIALERESLELSNRSALVAAVALQRCMRADQRKPVLMIPHSLERDLPALHSMAPLAIGTHLPTVDIGVAVSALCASICKHQLCVALGATEV